MQTVNIILAKQLHGMCSTLKKMIGESYRFFNLTNIQITIQKAMVFNPADFDLFDADTDLAFINCSFLPAFELDLQFYCAL